MQFKTSLSAIFTIFRFQFMISQKQMKFQFKQNLRIAIQSESASEQAYWLHITA